MDNRTLLWYIGVRNKEEERRTSHMDQKEIEALIAAGGAPVRFAEARC